MHLIIDFIQVCLCLVIIKINEARVFKKGIDMTFILLK